MFHHLMHTLMFGLLAVVALVSGDAHAKDKTYARVSCPESVRVKLNFENTIGADPQFKINKDGPIYVLPLADSGIEVVLNSSNHVDEFQCKYKFGALGQPNKAYHYNPKRTLGNCKRLSSRTVECLVQ